MATKYLSAAPKFQAFDSNGDPLSGGFLTFYEAGTTTPATTYSNSAGTSNASPIVLDARGEASVYLTAGLKYDVRLTSSTEVLVWTATRLSAPVTPSTYFTTLMDETTQTALFNIVVAPGGTVTGDWNFEDAAFNFAARVTVASAFSTPIGAAASNSTTITPTAISSLIWTSRSSAANELWTGVAWSPSLGLFAAVENTGVANGVMTSPDGVTWTIRAGTGFTSKWRAITWSASLGLFVAVATATSDHYAMTSPDGIVWTARTCPAGNYYSVEWSPDLLLFVAVGTSGSVSTSPDGITWTSRTAASANDWRSVVWSPSLALFVAVSNTGTSDRVMTSPDGTTWTSRTSAADYPWNAITWSPSLSLFVAVESSGLNTQSVMTSANGTSWTLRTAFSGSSWSALIWSDINSAFVVVSDGGQTMFSTNGTSWTSVAPAAFLSWSAIAWSNQLNVFAAVSYTGAGNRVMTGTGNA